MKLAPTTTTRAHSQQLARVVDYALLNKDYMIKKDIARKKRLVIADYPYLYPDSISFNDISGKDCLK